MKLLEILKMMVSKRISNYGAQIFLAKKKPWSEVSVNEGLPQELHKPVIKALKEEKSMPGLKMIFQQQV